MRRITVFSTEGRWSFTPGMVDPGATLASALNAANAVVVYAETLRGQAMGYVIPILPPSIGADVGESFTLHTQVF